MIALAVVSTGVSVFLTMATATGHGHGLFRIRLGPGRRRQDLGEWLTQAGLAVRPAQFRLYEVGSATVLFVVTWMLTGSWAVALIPAVAGGTLPRTYYGGRRRRRLESAVAAWPDGIRHLLAQVGAGATVHTALLSLAAHGPLALREAFARYPMLAVLRGPEAALRTVRAEMADPTSDWIIEVLLVALTEGGALALDILGTLAREASADLHVAAEIRAANLEPRITLKAAFAVPLFVLLFLCVARPDYGSFYQSAAALPSVLVAGGFSLLGLTVGRRLIREAEQRRVLR